MNVSRVKLVLGAFALTVLLAGPKATAGSISQTVGNPGAGATAAVNLTANATVQQILRIRLNDGVAAASDPSGSCVNASATSAIAAAGASGTSNLGTYDMDFSSGNPTNAMGCTSSSRVYAVQTFTLDVHAPAAATKVQGKINAGNTFDRVAFVQANNGNWTTDPGTALTSTDADLITGIGAGRHQYNIQIGYGVNFSSAGGAKTTQVTLTVVAP